LNRSRAITIARNAQGFAPHYRVRRAPAGLKHQTHILAADGRQRALSGGAVATPDEAGNEAALAILGDALRGDWPRAWRLVDAFEREFLTPLNVRDEIEIDAAAVPGLRRASADGPPKQKRPWDRAVLVGQAVS
jgi:hypothetical protein